LETLFALVALLGIVARPDGARELVREPKSGVVLPARIDGMSLLGMGLRTKSFLKLKVYVVGLYVADSALSGALAVHRGRASTRAFYRDLIVGDFEKQLVLKLVRGLSAEQIRRAFRTHLPAADKQLLARFLAYFGATRAGEECVIRWVPGSGLRTTVAGVRKPPIASKAFADAVFAIWLGHASGSASFRRQMVSRADRLLEQR
jgi:hypothetical protein